MWSTISNELQEFNIKMSSEQVRWKMNSLTKKYRECIDNNNKSGRSRMTFEFYNEMEEIFKKERSAEASYVISSNLPTKLNKNSSQINLKSKEKILNIENKEKLLDKENKEKMLNIENKEKATEIDNPKPSTSKIRAEEHGAFQKNSKKRLRPLHGTGSNRAKLKADLDQQCLDYLKLEMERKMERDQRVEKLLERRNENLQIKKRKLALKEKELDLKQVLETNKQKNINQRHEELMETERMKCKLLDKFLRNKENNFSDDDN